MIGSGTETFSGGSSSPERMASLKAAASSLLSLSFIASALGSIEASSDDIPVEFVWLKSRA